MLSIAVMVGLFFSFSFADTLTVEFPHKVDPKMKFQVHPFELNDVRLLDGPFEAAMEHNAEWLLSLEPDRLLSGFRKEAGLEPKAPVYGGWEKDNIAGHSLGHYLSACAMMYGETGRPEFKKRTDYIIDELALCQKASGSGYLSAFANGKKVFAEVARGEIRSAGFDLNGIWVPWYTQHKIIAGLRDVYHYTGNAKALDVWIKHADWINSIVGNLTDEQWQKMLACEHGGMNEVMADLYAITGDQKYLTLARKFYQKAVLDPLSRQEDKLAGLHANTQIPKIIGSARIYELTGEPKFETIADFFWKTVVDHYTYANGGNSSDEHFGRPDHLAERMHDTTETCNTYNMLKLTRHLFTWNPQASYMDYYERALFNHILAHQHPDKGGYLVYKGFLDMPARKDYSDPTNSFWCCVGTGMENHTKYADTIYAYTENALYVNLFIASELTWRDKGIVVTQETEIPGGDKVTLSFACKQPTTLALKIRKPYWAADVTMAVNGKSQDVSIASDGYITLNRTFKENDTVELRMPLKLHISRLPDKPSRIALLYGPTLLAAPMDSGRISPMLVSENAVSLLRSIQSTGPLEFDADKIAYQIVDNRLKPFHLRLVPLFAIADQEYSVYMDMFTPAQWQQKEADYVAEQERVQKLEAASADVLYPGQMQSERDHNLTGEKTNAGDFNGKKWRDARDGWIEFDMKVKPQEPMDLVCTYWGSDQGARVFDVLVDGEKIATQALNNNQPDEFFNVIYPIPVELTKDKDKIQIRFQSRPNNYAGGIFEVRTIIRSLNDFDQKADQKNDSAASYVSSVRKDYPYVPVPFTNVQFTDAFWLPRMETNRAQTIPFAFKMCEDTNRIENFKIAAGLSDNKWQGDFGFNDSDVYKVIEGASYSLMVKPDPQLDAYLDKVISYIAAAQEPDGYLYTAFTAKAKVYNKNIACCYKKDRWDNLGESHELYNLGHMYEAAAAHYLATGKKSFLDVATQSADLICTVFGPGKNEGIPGHQEIEIGLVKLYRATGNEKYLNQAKWFLNQRGRYTGFRSDYNQSHKPVVEQTEAVGHAVRANYMYSGMADVAALTGDQDFLKAIDTIWGDVANRKLYITGGVGARHAGEAYGDAYELPNRSAYCETCAAIANVYWNHRMFLLHGDSKYIDVMERSLYNSVISGVSLDGMKFFYPNPLECVDGYERSPWFGCACCPSNICRFLASVPGYVYAVHDDAVYLNLFVNSKAAFEVANQKVTFEQTTQYPWLGKIQLDVLPEGTAKFVLKVRIPDWARGTLDSSALYDITTPPQDQPEITVNGKSIPMQLDKGYVNIERIWNKGDTVVIDFPMTIERIVCDNRVAQDVGKAAIQRGPLVYCLEHPDIEDGRVLNLMLDKDTALTAVPTDDPVLGHITMIRGKAAELSRTREGRLERKSEQFSAIPYYAWAHRGKGQMAVWIPYTEENANPLPAPTIASESKVTASPVTGPLQSIVDQIEPQSSRDKDNQFIHWWPRKGTAEWVRFDFDKPTTLSAIEVYWLDDTGQGECRVPKSWSLLYLDGQEWKPVSAENGYSAQADQFNKTTFQPIKTTAVKMEIQLQDRWSAGIHEVRFE